MVATQVVAAQSSKDDPMAKVKALISDLIDKLEQKAAEEAEHHGWCNKELGSNKLTREKKTSKVEQLNAQIDELGANIEKENKEISELQSQVADIQKSMQVATEQRNTEHKENEATIADASEAQAAVAKALSVLKEFYDKAASAGGGYTGQQSSSTGVLGFLEVIAGDFARLQAETEAVEEENDRAYKKFMLENGGCGYHKGATVCGLKSEKEELIKKTEKSKKKHEAKKSRTENERDDVQNELNDANEYYDALQPQCVKPNVSVEERVQKREQEIQSLQEALSILEGQ